MSSFVFARSFAKSTSAWNGLMSPAAKACDWACSRHQEGSLAVLAEIVPGTGSCALKRNATSKNAAGAVSFPAPPGRVGLASAPGSR